MGFLGLVIDVDGEEIYGYVFVFDCFVEYWFVLDEFEGIEYWCVVIWVMLVDGVQVDVYVYVLCD